MLTKKKNIHKEKKIKTEKKTLAIWPRGSHNLNLKGVHARTSEIIDATDGRTDEFRFHELC